MEDDRSTTNQFGACKSKPRSKLKRHKSLEDLPTELKEAQDTTVRIFFQYAEVKKKSSCSVSAASYRSTVAHTRTTTAACSDSRASRYRRLRSEPLDAGGSLTGQTLHREMENSNASANSLAPQDPVARPTCLALEEAGSPKVRSRRRHNRAPSESSSGKTTPAPDPPLLSPGNELVATYPPIPVPARSCVALLESRSATELQAVLPDRSNAEEDTEHSPMQNGQDSSLSHPENARHIAQRLKVIGDRLNEQHTQEELEDLIFSFVRIPIPANGIERFMVILNSLRNHLTWTRVVELFQICYRLIEMLSDVVGTKPQYADERWTLFERLWDFIVNTLTRWVWEHGGWGAFLRATDDMESQELQQPDSSPIFSSRRRSSRLWSLSESGSFEEVEIEQEVECEGLEDPLQNETFPPVDEQELQQSTEEMDNLQLEEAEDFHDSGIVSSTEQLPLLMGTQQAELRDEGKEVLGSTPVDSPEFLQRRTNSDSKPSISCGTSDADQQPFDRNRSRSLPAQSRGRRIAPRRTSERAINGLLYTVNVGLSAAFVYTVVTTLLSK